MTMVELLASLAIVLIIMGGATAAYLKLFKGYKTQGKLSQTQVQSLGGLELLRYDIQMAGYGLPYLMNSVNYSEAVTNATFTVNPLSLNDAPTTAPRAFALSNGSPDVLAIKSQVADLNATTKKWSFLQWDATTSKRLIKNWAQADLDFVAGDRVIIVDQITKTLQKDGGGAWFFNYSTGYATDAAALPGPTDNTTMNLVYGVISGASPRMPFNRVDYYLSGTNRPSWCDPGASVLYRATISHSDGSRSAEPLLDCVRDFQVEFGLDTDGDKIPETWGQTLALTAAQIRQQLKEVRVFILIQEGNRDPDFNFSGTLNLTDSRSGVNLSSFTPAGDQVHYRWKVIEMAVKPMNLN